MADKAFDAKTFEIELEKKFQNGASPFRTLDDGDIPDYREEWYWLEEFFWGGPEKALIALRIFIKHGFRATAIDNCLKVLSHIQETKEWWPVFHLFASVVESPDVEENLSWSRMIHGERKNTMIEQCKSLGRMKQAAILEEIAKKKQEGAAKKTKAKENKKQSKK